MSDKDMKHSASISRRSFLQSSATLVAAAPLSAALLADAQPAAAAEIKPVPPAGGAEVKPAAPPAKSLLVERHNCTGCNSCVFACSLHHEGAVRPSAARVKVRRYYGMVDVPIICWHCVDAPCVEACPLDPPAIQKDKATNVVRYVHEDTCLGIKCNKCIEACPPEALRAHPDTGRPMFCDLCGGDPQCVKACDQQSLENGQTLRCDSIIGGIHRSFRDVTPEEAADGLMTRLFYPTLKGERR